MARSAVATPSISISDRPMRIAWIAALAGGWLAAGPAMAQQSPDLVSKTELRVCADPANLPFSNDKQEGFENKIAQLVAHELKLKLTYVWYPDSQGFVRATLMKHRCDVIMGTVVGNDELATTDPYYHTGYVMISRLSDNITADHIGDWHIAGRRFGLIAQTPPTDLVIRHNLMDRVAVYPLVVDTRVDQPGHQMVRDVADGKVDVGLLWGPIAGYWANQDGDKLRITFINPEDSRVRLDYHIAMGVRPGDVDFRRRLNGVIAKDEGQITKILRSYNIPLLDEQNHPLAADQNATPVQ